ncbi:MAG: glutamate--tRNA ligase [Deltaproteobacteria bacterium]|nr:glutamate--tRNA ligase [Deltaproteobacteria bacterium]MBW2399838.1 glutamate--tRNA ligase [Deltaproteobacteria bacterium]MBW2665275.1 glutamate--tRNA ligase [Deltaproteobacteria bacterium]
MSEIRTRFAPSPTGFLHLGSARTALFNWAYARRHGGKLILRIEDTDRLRSRRESEEAINDGLRWLGIEWDEGPFRQSERAERHAEVIASLVASRQAYRCRCTQEELEERKQRTIAAGGKWTYDGRCRDLDLGEECGPHTVRLRIREGADLSWNDGVFGHSGQDAREIGDMIIRRSDGNALFNVAVVVDDLDMGISHVIRGADHHPNTPFQIAIYQALNVEPPQFAHVPLIVGTGGKKLSKRRDPVSIQHFRAEGYLPQAVCNWLIRLGWSHGDQEVFSAEEITSLFDLEAVNRSSAQADPGKFQWLNQHYLKQLPGNQLLREVLPFLEAEVDAKVEVTPGLERLLDLLRERSKTLVEMAQQARFLVVDAIEIDEKAARKHLKPAIAPALSSLAEALDELGDWSESEIEAAFERVLAAHGDLKIGKLAQPVRVAITGGTISPGIFETLAALGHEKAVRRIRAAIRGVESTAESRTD